MLNPMRDLSVVKLEQILERKRLQLERLTRQRISLQRKLEKVEREIVQIGGDNGTTLRVRRKIRRRPKNTKPLAEVVVDILKKQKAGLSLAQLAEKIQQSGYRSHSADFKNVVYQCLYNNRKTIVHDDQAGVYKMR
jgi:hypothetical protein